MRDDKKQRDIFDPDEMQAWAEGMAKKSREKREKSTEPTKAASNVVRLPIWPESICGVPDGVLRSALFGAIRRGRRQALEGEIIPSLANIIIRYTGWRLDQTDMDAWEALMHLCRLSPLGEKVYFSAHSLLKAIGRGTGRSQHEWLKSVFRRLTANAVEITVGKKTYMGPLIHHCARDEETGLYAVVLNPKLIALYGKNDWTQIEWTQRLALKGQPLAQWLHGFYSTHAEPHSMKVETLHRLCRSETSQMFHFRAELREALEHLEKVTGWIGAIDKESDLVNVVKQPTKSQQKHLVKKARKPRQKP